MICILIIILLLLGYVLSMAGRRGNKALESLEGWAYAHRGLHGNGVPENSMLAFQRAKQAGYGIELDVHLTKDGSLAVIHDSSLKRTTGLEGIVEELCEQDLSSCYLEGTMETIPVLEDVLYLYNGAAPLIIELKSNGNNYSRLCSTVCRSLERYQGAFCLESFDPRCIRWLRKNRPDLVRGQLAENYFRTKDCRLPWLLKLLLSNQMLNFLTRPDFIAYKHSDRKHISNRICRHIWKLKGVSWTLTDHEAYHTAVREGWLPIFESFLP